jgi:hypothetical protein
MPLPKFPQSRSKIFREASAKVFPVSSRIAKKRGLESELIHSDEMQSLAEESWSSTEMIALMKKVMEHPLCRPRTKLCRHFLYIPDLFCAPIFTLVPIQIS